MMAEKDFDDIKAVLHSLRHHCSNCRKLKNAIKVIANKTELSETRVEFIIKKYIAESVIKNK